MPLPPIARFLDTRPIEEARSRPIADSVNIPLEELAGRMHELPSRHGVVRLAGDSSAIAFLTECGRNVELARDWTYGENGPARLWSPNAFLARVLAEIAPRRALDLACGSGRDAVTLAASGWKVTAVDHLTDALELGRDLASRYLSREEASRIEWIQMDLDQDQPEFGRFDLVSSFWFLDRRLFRSAADGLRLGASLVLETFTAEHRKRFGKPRTESFVLASGELASLAEGLNVRILEEGWHEDRHSARLCATRDSA